MAKKKKHYYVSYYEEYPIYEPAEGTKRDMCRIVRKISKYFRKIY